MKLSAITLKQWFGKEVTDLETRSLIQDLHRQIQYYGFHPLCQDCVRLNKTCTGTPNIPGIKFQCFERNGWPSKFLRKEK